MLATPVPVTADETKSVEEEALEARDARERNREAMVCSLDNREACLMCSG